MDRSQAMGEGSIPRLLLKFSIPAIVGMLVNALYNVVDRIFIGLGVGPLGIAGVTVGFPIMIVQMAFGMLIGMVLMALELKSRQIAANTGFEYGEPFKVLHPRALHCGL